MISLVGASGGSSSGTGSPLRRITTKTTVVTSHTATSARRIFGARNATIPGIGMTRPGAPTAGPRTAGGYARLNLKLKGRISNCWFGFGVNSTYFCSP